MSVKISKADLFATPLKIKNDCYIEGVENDYGPTKKLHAWGETANSFYLPFYYYKNVTGISPNKRDFPRVNYSFNFDFRNPDQKQVFNEAMHKLKKDRTVLLALRTSFGKTYLGIRLAFTIGFKTAVLVHRQKLFEQWQESIEKFTTGKVQMVKSGEQLDPAADFYIINITTASKVYDSNKKEWVPQKLGFYKNIGLLIVDEAHVACADQMAKALLYFTPRMTIALTATPKRADGMSKLLDLYFGTEPIVRISQIPFTVYRLATNIKPKFEYNSFGRKDWSSVVDYLTSCKKRNELIVEITKQFSNKNIIIFTKLVKHCDLLTKMLEKSGESVTKMRGSDKNYSPDARILISTYSKLGVGFDDPKFDLEIIAMSVKEVEQYAGRIRDKPGREKIIVDMVDDDSNCKQHWLGRRKWYKSRNGTIKNLKITGFHSNENSPKNTQPVRLAKKHSG